MRGPLRTMSAIALFWALVAVGGFGQSAQLTLAQANVSVRFFVLDLAGDGLKLTSVSDGVVFDVDSSGTPIRTAWTAPKTDDAFVIVKALRSAAVRGDQLLGTGLSLPDGRRLVNPDRALMAVQGYDLGPDFRTLDTPENRRRIVTLGPEDEIYNLARVWVDRNHNGRAEADELQTLAGAGVLRLNSAFRIRRSTDGFGSVFGPLGNFATLVKGVEVWRDMHVVQFARK
jgi:hypothetical protein